MGIVSWPGGLVPNVLDDSSLDSFKRMAEESGTAYQTLINMYLRDCAASGRKLNIDWH